MIRMQLNKLSAIELKPINNFSKIAEIDIDKMVKVWYNREKLRKGVIGDRGENKGDERGESEDCLYMVKIAYMKKYNIERSI